jgi:hypothetical protein
MTATNPLSPVDVRPGLTAREFYAEYVNRKPVLIEGALAGLPATARWSLAYLRDLEPDLVVRLKAGRVADGVTERSRLADYAKAVAEWEELVATGQAGGPPPPYLHDVPLLRLIPRLKDDLEGFPAHFLPAFFRKHWWVFPQFFVGPSRSETPLHFDTLLTHNLFFQFHGSKRFVMVENKDRGRCHVRNWRWSPIDPEAPDLERFPGFAGVGLLTAEVGAGDLFYMPPGTVHKVISHSDSVSFNIDWHDRVSALRSLAAVRAGMPVANLRYNILLALGVCAHVPLGLLMPALKSYFEYIS